MVVIFCFLLALGAGQLACWLFCILASMGCHSFLLVLDAKFTPHQGLSPVLIPTARTFFGLLTLSLICTLLSLLGNSSLLHPHLSRVLKILGGSSQAYPSRHPLQRLLFQVPCWIGGLIYPAPGLHS